jgi:tetratricopeptide (TPR) repeat protein
MIEKTLKKPFLGLVAVCILIAASIPFQIGIDNIRGKFKLIEDSLYVSSSSLKKISFGYKELLADIYWIRALQYFGSTGLQEQNPAHLYHYFDIITDLDPGFVNAYRYGGTFLAEPEPFGLGDLEKGTNLLDKGMKNNPENFRLPLEAAFLYYLYPKDYEKAAVLFKTASEKPGLSNSRKSYLSGMAATAHSQGGDRKLSRKIWEMIYETNPSENRRKFALMNIKEIDTMNIEDKLTLALREYIKSGNETPDSLDALVISGTLRGIPASPIGGEFVIAPGIVAVKNTELAQRRFAQHLGLLNTKSVRFKISNGAYPRDLAELRKYIELNTTADYPEHPLGEEYGYDPETGKVTSGIKQ